MFITCIHKRKIKDKRKIKEKRKRKRGVMKRREKKRQWIMRN